MVPYDEPEIQPEDRIIRRINPDQHVIRDENRGVSRVSSKAFSPSSGPNGGMSVDILALIDKAGVDAAEFVTTPIFTGSVSFPAKAARDAALMIGYDPIEGTAEFPENPYHGEVWGSARPNKFTNPQKKAIQSASEWFVEIPGVAVND